jgi:cell division protein FtsQ
LEANNDRQYYGKAAARRKVRRRRHGSPVLFYITLAIMLAATLAVLSVTVFWSATAITVTGLAPYSPDEISAVAGVKISDNLLRVDIKKAETAVLETFPYIESVSVNREFPSVISIQVTPARPAYQLEGEKGVVLVSENGRVLETAAGQSGDLPLIMGVAAVNPVPCKQLEVADSEIGALARYIMSELIGNDYKNVDWLDVSLIYDIRVKVEGRLLLKVGSSADLPYKLAYAKRVIDLKIEPDAVGVLDLSWITSQKSDVYFRRQPID